MKHYNYSIKNEEIFTIALLLLIVTLDAGSKDRSLVQIEKITNSVYRVVSEFNIGNNTMYPANAMFVITNAGVVLVDTPWDDARTDELLGLIKKKFKKDVILGIITHFHNDRIGGIGSLLKRNVKVYSSHLTATLAQKDGYPAPEKVYSNDTVFTVGNTKIEYYYPGEGHTKDNTVVYLPGSKVLFAGCLIKDLDSQGAGNIADANLSDWSASIRKMAKRFPDAKIVIPGHFRPGGRQLLEHTIELVNNTKGLSS